MPSGPIGGNVKDNEVQKRDSIYQSSREIRKTRNQGDGKMILESVDSKEAFLSFDVVDSAPMPCQMEQVSFDQQMKSPLVSLDAEQKSPSVVTSQSTAMKAIEFLEPSFRLLSEENLDRNSSNSGYKLLRNNSANRCYLHSRNTTFHSDQGASEFIEHGLDVVSKSELIQVHGSENDGNTCHEKNIIHAFTKSSSAKVGTFNSPCHFERGFYKASSKHRFSSLKKVLDPIMKYKSLRNLPLNEAVTSGVTTSVFRKSLLSDFSSSTERIDHDETLIGGNQILITGPSSAHLHGTLKLEFKQGVPTFEFSIKDPDLVLFAKTWKTNNAFNWVYTFHKKKSSSIVWGAKDRHKQSSPTVGQMHVSGYLSSEGNCTKYSDNTMVTEFVLYDTDQARKSYNSDIPLDKNSSMEQEKCKHQVKHASNDNDLIVSASYPLAPSELHPQHEIAAMVTHIPLSKKDGSKELQADEVNTTFDQRIDTFTSLYPSNINVVTPSGRHGSPYTEGDGPSSLLDRWRSGGGCDCGGWDMGCPIVVFENSFFGLGNHLPHESQQLTMLFAQGRKEKIPTLSIKADGNGQYSIQFHARLSALQAFSICIAMLHGSETSEKKLKLYPNSLNFLLEDEVISLIEEVNKEKEKKTDKMVEQVHPYFHLDPPFSPMSR
ncbi:hypothetical protein J5N97_023068 [Dioscorea zingiberensis]|uniref:Uncharacterized protein n=1 Tax=Dioscorea zingiberensis TaxID=325984 RepID=A0A9D5CBB6_9LILI|nr:hypothetical protein J5N97_023068 [Dioscorea zingiberensis]